MGYFNGYRFNYSNRKKHPYRDAFLGMLGQVLRPLPEIGLALLILNLCHVTDISYIGIAAFWAAWVIGALLVDILNIQVDKMDYLKEMKEWEEMRNVPAYREEADPGCESGDSGETYSYSGYGETD